MSNTLFLLSLYGEQAYYLERTESWIERVGLKYVQEIIVDDAEERKALSQHLYASQTVSQKKPWTKCASCSFQNSVLECLPC